MPNSRNYSNVPNTDARGNPRASARGDDLISGIFLVLIFLVCGIIERQETYMKIIIKTTKIDLSPSIRQYVEEKIGGLEKFLKNFSPELVEARVEIGKTTRGQRQGDIFRAEVNLSLNGKLLRASEVAESLHAAIDLVKDELAREIRRCKEKETTKFVRGARSWKKFWQVNPLARFRDSQVGKVLRKK